MEKFVIYCRVSSVKQGQSGLGLDDQLNTCREHVEKVGGEIVGEFQDVKSGSKRTRQGMIEALSCAKENDATIVFAKLDRLARDAEYSYSIRNSGVQLYFCDFPEINSLMFGILVAVAQYERELGISRTKDSLRSIRRNIEQNGYHTARKSGRMITHLGAPKGWEHTENAREASARAKILKIGSDPNRKRQFLLMKNLYAHGNNLEAITNTLNLTGEKTPKGKQWTIGGVSQAIRTWGKYFNINDNE